jgi:hypothetical protein
MMKEVSAEAAEAETAIIATMNPVTPVLSQNLKRMHRPHNNSHKKRSRARNKIKGIGKSPRTQCTVCGKTAVRYYDKHYTKDGRLKSRNMIYEHRDEPPIKEFIYRGIKHKQYRRCNAGPVQEGLPLIYENRPSLVLIDETEEYMKVKNELVLSKDDLKELDEIANDITGEEAKRILKNIRCWIEDKRSKLKEDS